MKATTFRLFATMITLAAITFISSVPVQAQRRSTPNGVNGRETVKRNQRSEVTTKSASKTYRQSTPIRSENRSRITNSGNNNRKKANVRSGNRIINQPRQENRATQANRNSGRSNEIRQNSNNSSGNVNRSRQSINIKPNNNTGTRRKATKVYTNPKAGQSASAGRRSTGNTSTNTRKYYNIDRNDKRYTPNENYRGSRKQWSSNYRSRAMNYNRRDKKFYSSYNYRQRNHWDRSWERYHWNYNSWRDYYNGYNPYSYRYHKYYYHHNHYGHVIRRFVYPPTVFVHNHLNYYCFDGHFFRHHPGVGYVLVDIPFGFSFSYLPQGYERVQINGYLYFRIGNLFFESTGFGFRLVHYPDRYYAYNDNYYSDGYVFEDEYYYEPY